MVKNERSDTMKFGFISDIHLDMAKEDLLPVFIETLENKDIDTLVIAGDITEDADETIRVIDELNQTLPYPTFYVPGNHDMWNKANKQNTLSIYEKFRNHKYCLTNQIVTLNDFYLIGDIFWYDYSYANQKVFSIDQLENKQFDKRKWKDSLYVNWNMDDTTVSNHMIDTLKAQLNLIDPTKTIVISHMINHPKFSVPESKRKEWGFFNAFLGSNRLYETLLEENVNYAVCGHVHFRHTIKEKNTTFICPCLSYEKEWQLFDDSDLSPEYHINKTLKIINTDENK